jgi:predicted aconitase
MRSVNRSPLELSRFDQSCLRGDEGPAARFAMTLITEVARATAASRLIDISQAHLVGSYDSGPANVKFLDLMLEQGAKVRVPTTLNASSACVESGSPSAAQDVCRARDVIRRYTAMGCTPTLTCAPYHLSSVPRKGEAIAWAESNAIVYANSVIGARTNKTMQYLDLCAAITGRIPASGLYLDDKRLATVHIDCSGISVDRWHEPLSWQLLGLLTGAQVGSAVPVLTGMAEQATADDLRALGSGAASSGNVAMFHAVGLTAEAPDLETATGGRPVTTHFEAGDRELDKLENQYGAAPGTPVSAICLGTPHFSFAEFQQLLVELVATGQACVIPFYVTTSRHVRDELDRHGYSENLAKRGVRVVTDSCSYYGRVVPGLNGTVMTNSAKWAYYASGNLGINPTLSSLSDCVASAISGQVER